MVLAGGAVGIVVLVSIVVLAVRWRRSQQQNQRRRKPQQPEAPVYETSNVNLAFVTDGRAKATHAELDYALPTQTPQPEYATPQPEPEYASGSNPSYYEIEEAEGVRYEVPVTLNPGHHSEHTYGDGTQDYAVPDAGLADKYEVPVGHNPDSESSTA